MPRVGIIQKRREKYVHNFNNKAENLFFIFYSSKNPETENGGINWYNKLFPACNVISILSYDAFSSGIQSLKAEKL